MVGWLCMVVNLLGNDHTSLYLTLFLHLPTTDEQNEGDGDEEGNNDNNNGQNQNGYYGYGYYDAYGNWVTPYKTMFQIQYFQIVLWTSVSLVVLLFYVIYKMIDMPLLPDTLLFGESAKAVGD